MSQGIPTEADMLRALIEAGGTLPQSYFNSDWNDAGDFCFWHGLTSNDVDKITITDKGRKVMSHVEPTDDPPQAPPRGTLARAIWNARGGPPPAAALRKGFA